MCAAKSVLENMHAMNAFLLFTNPKCNFLKQIDEGQFKEFKKKVVDLILNTDMAVRGLYDAFRVCVRAFCACVGADTKLNLNSSPVCLF